MLGNMSPESRSPETDSRPKSMSCGGLGAAGRGTPADVSTVPCPHAAACMFPHSKALPCATYYWSSNELNVELTTCGVGVDTMETNVSTML